MMVAYLARDISSGIAILERVPTDERNDWLPRLARKNYKYGFGKSSEGKISGSVLIEAVRNSVAHELGPSYLVTAAESTTNATEAYLDLRLRDGTPLHLTLILSVAPLTPWIFPVFAIQIGLLIVATLFAVRLITRPLAQLVQAADEFGPNLHQNSLPEKGPMEVVRALTAFNAMQRRIGDFVSERARFLAAISHDLQTPVTRMRLRTDLLVDEPLRDKFNSDLNSIQALIEESIAYARDGQSVDEPICPTDLNALLESMVYDYLDAGESVRIVSCPVRTLMTRPHALRRVIGNLVDNALKFGGDVEIAVALPKSEDLEIWIRDRGPGIPISELEAVMQPFYRLEHSRNRDTGGSGLGLASAVQLTQALGGSLTLSNRDGGGLQARVQLPLNLR